MPCRLSLMRDCPHGMTCLPLCRSSQYCQPFFPQRRHLPPCDMGRHKAGQPLKSSGEIRPERTSDVTVRKVASAFMPGSVVDSGLAKGTIMLGDEDKPARSPRVLTTPN
jgi:hypothetical protein